MKYDYAIKIFSVNTDKLRRQLYELGASEPSKKDVAKSNKLKYYLDGAEIEIADPKKEVSFLYIRGDDHEAIKSAIDRLALNNKRIIVIDGDYRWLQRLKTSAVAIHETWLELVVDQLLVVLGTGLLIKLGDSSIILKDVEGNAIDKKNF